MSERETTFGDPPGADRPSLPGGWAGQALPFLLLLAAAAWLALHWGDIPDPYVSHWNTNFEPDGWSGRTLRSVFGLHLFGLCMCASLVLVGLGLRYRARTVGGSKESRDAEWCRRWASLQIIFMANVLTGVLVAAVSLHPLAQTPQRIQWLLGGVLALAVVGPLLSLVWIGLRVVPLYFGREAGPEGQSRAARAGEAGGPEHWKLGLIYHNPDDPALFVEKRVGIGYTLNFARGEVWALLGLMLAVPVLLLVWALS